MNQAAQPLSEVDLNDPDAVISGIDGMPGDDQEENTDGDVSHETVGSEAANEDKAPTRLERLKSADIGDLIQRCSKHLDEMDQIAKERSELNADNQAIREKFEAMGISKKALDAARKVIAMDAEGRDGFFAALTLLCKAGGFEINKTELQLGLFDD